MRQTRAGAAAGRRSVRRNGGAFVKKGNQVTARGASNNGIFGIWRERSAARLGVRQRVGWPSYPVEHGRRNDWGMQRSERKCCDGAFGRQYPSNRPATLECAGAPLGDP